MKGWLVLSDGRAWEGASFGHTGETVGEVVFNTSMTGYQEILTDPSYHCQIVCMTYPEIGNYGVNSEDVESRRTWVPGLVVRQHCQIPSNWRCEGTLNDYMRQNKIVGLAGIDTRSLVRHIRTKGCMSGILASGDHDPEDLRAKALAWDGISGHDIVCEVTTDKTYVWPGSEDGALHVVVYDLGVKHNILRLFSARDCRLTVVPASTTTEEVMALNPDGVFLSNGPGDPRDITYVTDSVRRLIGRVPLFGICLGHQVIGQAFGGTIFKLKFGHRAANHPVKDDGQQILITSQNHGYGVVLDSLPEEVEVTDVNLNDGTAEGLRHKSLPVLSVQYHPEASPGPHEASTYFDRFIDIMKTFKKEPHAS